MATHTTHGNLENTPADLAREAARLQGCFVGAQSPPLDAAYAKAVDALQLPQNLLVDRLVAAGADLRSAEWVWRRRSQNNPLTTRALIMLTLAEARPEFRESFELRGRSGSRVWTEAARAVLGSPLRWIKGAAQLWWYGR